MILHTVLIRFKAQMQESDKQALYAAVKALAETVDAKADMLAGANGSSEGLDGGYQDGYAIAFTSRETRNEFLKHPDYLVLGDTIVAQTDGGLSGILVFDFDHAGAL